MSKKYQFLSSCTCMSFILYLVEKVTTRAHRKFLKKMELPSILLKLEKIENLS